MIILKDAYLLSFDPKYEFGKYSLLIDENCVADIAKQSEIPHGDEEKTKLQKWIEQYGSQADVIDCSSKLIMPAIVNSCVKSEGSLVKYLLRNRHYELTDGDLYTDFIFNYLYQEIQTGEIRVDLDNIYRYSFAKNLKSGICLLNEFSLRKDENHLESVANAVKMTGQKVSVCYPIKQEESSISHYEHLSPSYFITDESQLNIYDISTLCELKSKYVEKLFLEVSTNKEVVEKFTYTFGKPIIKLLDEYGLIDSSTSLINPLYLSYDEMKIVADKKANIIVCPGDLIHFTTRFFPIDDFINHSIKYSIATGWLGDDLFSELRIFKNRYKELNITYSGLLKAVTRIPAELYFIHEGAEENSYCISPNRTADLVFFDLSDLRFQLMPESRDFEHMCAFLVDNLSSHNVSDVMINGDFKVRNHKPVNFNEDEVIRDAEFTRKRLYKVAKYEEISERKKQRRSIEMLDLRNRNEDEIKLFSESIPAKSLQAETGEEKVEFRIKSKMPVFKHKTAPEQKNLFEGTGSNLVLQIQEYQESPMLNLLYTEVEEVRGVEDEVLRSKLVDDKILKQVSDEKKVSDSKMKDNKSKIELPKKVKLRFGDDD